MVPKQKTEWSPVNSRVLRNQTVKHILCLTAHGSRRDRLYAYRQIGFHQAQEHKELQTRKHWTAQERKAGWSHAMKILIKHSEKREDEL